MRFAINNDSFHCVTCDRCRHWKLHYQDECMACPYLVWRVIDKEALGQRRWYLKNVNEFQISYGYIERAPNGGFIATFRDGAKIEFDKLREAKYQLLQDSW